MNPGTETKKDLPQLFARVNLQQTSLIANIITSTKMELPFDTFTTQVVFCSKSTYKLRISIGVHTQTLDLTESLLGIGTELNLINDNIIYQEWNSCA